MITKDEITRFVPLHRKLGFYLFDTESRGCFQIAGIY
jgi:hypothetical protein